MLYSKEMFISVPASVLIVIRLAAESIARIIPIGRTVWPEGGADVFPWSRSEEAQHKMSVSVFILNGIFILHSSPFNLALLLSHRK